MVEVRAKAPLRVSFAGGGTDVEPYVTDYGSYVVSCAIKLYARATCGSVNQGQTELEMLLSRVSGKHIRVTSDVTPTSGLGASASCFIAGLKAIYPQLLPEQLAQLALFMERSVLGIKGGNQDQQCAAHGGLLFIVTEGDRTEITKLDIPPTLLQHLVLIYTGNRSIEGKDIIGDQITRYNTKALHKQKQVAATMKDVIKEGDLTSFGKLLNEAWQSKVQFSPLITNDSINAIYSKCLASGAIGGVLTGAGGGGYMVFMENPSCPGELRYNLVREGISYWNMEIDLDGVSIV